MGVFDRFIFLSGEPLCLVASEHALCSTKFFGAELTPPPLHVEY